MKLLTKAQYTQIMDTKKEVTRQAKANHTTEWTVWQRIFGDCAGAWIQLSCKECCELFPGPRKSYAEDRACPCQHYSLKSLYRRINKLINYYKEKTNEQ